MSKTIFLLSPRFESHILKLSRHCCFISKTRPLNLIFDVFPKHLKKKKKKTHKYKFTRAERGGIIL